MKTTLSPIERRALKAQAHALDPVVMIGDQGLTPSVILEIERNLKAHELIKVRASTGDREARESWLHEICLALHASPIQHIGKMLIIWRKKPEEVKKEGCPADHGPANRCQGRRKGRSHHANTAQAA